VSYATGIYIHLGKRHEIPLDSVIFMTNPYFTHMCYHRDSYDRRVARLKDKTNLHDHGVKEWSNDQK